MRRSRRGWTKKDANTVGRAEDYETKGDPGKHRDRETTDQKANKKE